MQRDVLKIVVRGLAKYEVVIIRGFRLALPVGQRMPTTVTSERSTAESKLGTTYILQGTIPIQIIYAYVARMWLSLLLKVSVNALSHS
jgi:hypothetical protein